MSLIDMVREQLGAGGVEAISKQIGADPAATEDAIEAAVPMLLGGMAGAAEEPEGADAINTLMGSPVATPGAGGAVAMNFGGGLDGGGLGGALGGVLGGLLAGGGGGAGGAGGILGQILRRNQEPVQQGVERASGLDGAKVQQLLTILAPIVIAALARRRTQAAAAQPSQPSMGQVLQREALEAQARAKPQVGGILGSILARVTTQGG